MFDKSIFNIESLLIPQTERGDLRSPAGIIPLLEKYFGSKKVRILEIGVFKGGLTKEFASSALSIAEYDGVDPYSGMDSDPYTGNYWQGSSDADSIYRNTMSYYNSQGFQLYRMMSGEFFNKFYRKKTYDIIYIDGDHRFCQAFQDIEDYAHMLSEDGLILVDDYANVDTPDVTKALNLFLDRYKTAVKHIGYYVNPFQNRSKYIPIVQTTVYFSLDINVLHNISSCFSRRHKAIKKFESIKTSGINRIALFGCGSHLNLLEHFILEIERPDIVAILDDNPKEEKQFFGLTPIRANSFDTKTVDAIVLSTDVNQDIFRKRCIELYGSEIPIIDIYQD